MNIRPAQAEDAAALAEIYQVYVYRGLMTFDETPPDAAAMRAKIDTVQQAGLPLLVTESAEGVRGYAYATPYRDRSAYRYTLEDAIYLASDARGQGHGKALLAPSGGRKSSPSSTSRGCGRCSAPWRCAWNSSQGRSKALPAKPSWPI